MESTNQVQILVQGVHIAHWTLERLESNKLGWGLLPAAWIPSMGNQSFKPCKISQVMKGYFNKNPSLAVVLTILGHQAIKWHSKPQEWIQWTWADLHST